MAAAGPGGLTYDVKGWQPAVRSGVDFRAPRDEELIPLPPGAQLQFLEGRHPLGWPKGSSLEEPPVALVGERAVAAQLPSGYARTLLPAYQRGSDGPPFLPFFGYAAVVYRGGQAYCGAIQTDSNPCWAPERYAGSSGPLRRELQALIEKKKALHPGNRVVEQLTTCALEYGCYNAQNIFWGRWEGAVTVSPACNAECIGCISLQPDGLPPSPQERFRFVPTAAEIVELGLAHLQGDNSIYSFGQGCEGEPLLQADRIAESIRTIRGVTRAGTLHLNTNASRPAGFRKVCEAGLDSVRVSLNSVLSEPYTAYYQPRGYTFEDVRESTRIAHELGLAVYLNYLHVPGWNDRQQEIDALIDFVRDCGVQAIQMRSLNIDPDLYASSVPLPGGAARGIPGLLASLKQGCPGLLICNHTLPHRLLAR